MFRNIYLYVSTYMYAITIRVKKEPINLKEYKVGYIGRIEGGTGRDRLLKKMYPTCKSPQFFGDTSSMG